MNPQRGLTAAVRAGLSRAVMADGVGIHPRASIGENAIVHSQARVSELARIGTGCVIAAGCYVGPSVIIGQSCRLEENAFVHESALVEDGVRLGAGAVLANQPAAYSPADEGAQESGFLVGVTVRSGTVIGAHAVCLAPAVIGRWAVVADGAVVTDDVPDYALVAGAPARRIGWVGRAGVALEAQADGAWLCPVTSERYLERGGSLELVDD